MYLMGMISNVRVEAVVASPVAVIRRTVSARDLGRLVPELCGLVWQVLKAAPVNNAGRNIAIYRKAEGGQIAIAVGVEVATSFPGQGEVVASVTPAGDAATVTHLGPYGGLGSAHQAIHDWASANGRTLSGTRWEIYGHWQPAWNTDPAQIRTDIFYLLQ